MKVVRIGALLPTELKKIIYFAFVHSQLSYGIEIYGNTYPTYLHKLNMVYGHFGPWTFRTQDSSALVPKCPLNISAPS